MKFRTLVLPVFIAVTISIAAIAAMVIIAVIEQDRIALDNERKILLHSTEVFEENLLNLARDSAWWDIAVEKLYIQKDTDWARYNLGDTVTKIDGVDGIIVLMPDNTILYEESHKENVDIVALYTTLQPLLNRMSLAEIDALLDVSGYTSVNGLTVSYGASMVRPNGIFELNTDLTPKMPIILFFGNLTQTRMKAIGIQNGIRDVTLNFDKNKGDGNLALYDYNAEPIAIIRWASSQPGSHLAKRLMLPLIPMLALIVGALVYFTRQALKVIEELDRANRSKSTFLASMSHEIRTPLNSILGFTELVSLEMFGRIEGDKNKEYLKLIRGSGEHLLSIINDILDLSKLEANKYDIHAEQIKPNEIIEACVNMLHTTAEDCGIEVRCSSQPTMIMSDERIVRQILLNVISNALKFTQRGGLVEVRGKRHMDYYRIDVKDNGIGMTEEEVKIALTPFGQVASEYARNHSGTGLGLPLVSRFVSLLDGQMSINSRPDYGTTITILLPYKTKPKQL